MKDEMGYKIVSLLEGILNELKEGRKLSEQNIKDGEIKGAKMEGEFKGLVGSIFSSMNQKKPIIETRKNEAIINGK